MKTPKTFIYRSGKSIFLLLIIVSFTACSALKKGVDAFYDGDLETAREKLEKAEQKPKYQHAAQGWQAKIDVRENPTTPVRIQAIQTLCETEAGIRQLPIKQRAKLDRLRSSRKEFETSRTNLQLIVYEDMTTKGTISELVLLVDKADCWPMEIIDTLKAVVVNKNIDPNRDILVDKLDDGWLGTPVAIASPEDVMNTPGLSCNALDRGNPKTLTYDDVRTISERFSGDIITDNYVAFWDIQDDIWHTFQRDKSYCEMPRFKEHYPGNRMVVDCWFDSVQDTLCLSELRPLLAFHRNNPHTAFDEDICEHILCLENFASDRNQLNKQEKEQLEDIHLMFDLWLKAKCCRLPVDLDLFIEQTSYLAQKYPHHQVVYAIAQKVVECLVFRAMTEETRTAIAALRPLYPDSMVCNPPFGFQVDKQAWFDKVEYFLNRAKKIEPPMPVEAWNTLENDEYSMISWGGSKEVFFVRRSREDGEAMVMTSWATPKGWSPPKPVKELSISSDIVLLSISSQGRQLLLNAGGKLFQAYRPDVGRPWLNPSPLGMNKRFAGNAWLSPDDSTLLVSFYSKDINPLVRPSTNIARMPLGINGRYQRAFPLEEQVNLSFSNEANPVMALGGRLLFYTSDNEETSLGEKDIYSVSLSNPRDWSTLGNPINLGLPVNTLDDDAGITYFSEYTGKAYFQRLDVCNDDLNIYEVQLESGIFPTNAMRCAGLVIDENNEAVGGGFMEFTPNYKLDVHSEPITAEGTYVYTVADSTEVVRLFPEVPGYYSERDTTHFLANIAKGEILRDTFRLTSFDYIRQNFRLINSTFINGMAQFDQPAKAYPELNRLAKIAVRMGAEIQLNGHTDAVGTAAENLRLSIDRAESVKQFLVSRCGFDPAKIHLAGYGATKPRCKENTEACRNLNRRIDVVFKMPVLPGGSQTPEIRN